VSVSVANGVRALAVLVVEDDFFVRCDVAGCLREAGYTVIETESGEAAIALCKSEMTNRHGTHRHKSRWDGNRMGCG
jgi:response regulator RpfG family c-di-GMP phosphodiesterase